MSFAVAVLPSVIYASQTWSKSSLEMGGTCNAVGLGLQSVFGVFCNILQDGNTNDPLFKKGGKW